MITNKWELNIRQDCLCNIGKEQVNWLVLNVHCFYGNDRYRVFRYLKSLRWYENSINCLKSPVGLLFRVFAKIRWHRLGAKYGININPNVVGYGFRVPHLVGGG